MANTKSAKKQAKQNEKCRVRNLARRTAIKTSIKKMLAMVEEGASEVQKATSLLSDIAAKLSRAKSKGVMHRNTASRKLSRLAKKLHGVTATQS